MTKSETRIDTNRPNPALSAIVPCYNEQECIAELYQRLSAICRRCFTDDYEIILINDGSTDGTWPAICNIAEDDANVVGVNLSRVHGHQIALTAGFSVCRGERIFVIDADLQDPPELLADMLKLMDDGAEVVYGKRRTRQAENSLKRFTAAAFYRILQRLSDIEIPLDTGDFRLMTRRVLSIIQQMPEQNRFLRGMVSWAGFRQVPLLYDRAERFAGETKYPLRKMLSLAVDAITGFSIRPLRIASYAGVLLGVFAVVLMTYTFYSWLILDTVRGWTSLMTVVLMLGSVQLLLLGLFGEYLGRLYMEVKRRPLFVISDIISGPVIEPSKDPDAS